MFTSKVWLTILLHVKGGFVTKYHICITISAAEMSRRSYPYISKEIRRVCQIQILLIDILNLMFILSCKYDMINKHSQNVSRSTCA